MFSGGGGFDRSNVIDGGGGGWWGAKLNAQITFWTNAGFMA
jgi:hypothetical protein